ncbi:hypothetical protein GDO78_002198 [Eleutherodactylus coqui]|uniref:Uncharacterized protein n=1 Tax=Eleutherodactylus coqui TaxID=57060 RepID=A0A8J6K605_ELECQ|nr:hypothetical protein GDO78_002198 [Eleutherodactylus coqui]
MLPTGSVRYPRSRLSPPCQPPTLSCVPQAACHLPGGCRLCPPWLLLTALDVPIQALSTASTLKGGSTKEHASAPQWPTKLLAAAKPKGPCRTCRLTASGGVTPAPHPLSIWAPPGGFKIQ